MFIDSTVLYGLIKELKASLLSAQVKQIHQIDARVFDIELYRPMASSAHLILCIQTPPYFYAVTGNKKTSYVEPQTFCMSLRKNLEGSRLSVITQIQMDRIVKISFDRIEAEGKILTKDLYVELIPSAPNLILTENDRVVDVLIHSKKQHRELYNQKKYVLPEGTDRLNFMEFSSKELTDLLCFHASNGSMPLKSFFFSVFNGLSAPLINEISHRATVKPEQPMSSLSVDACIRIAQAMASLTEQIQNSAGLYVYSEGNKELLSVVPLSAGAGAHIPSISSWFSQFSEKKGSAISSDIQNLRRYVHQLIKREKRKVQKIQGELDEAANLEKYRLWGNLLSIYSYMKTNGMKEIIVDNPFEGENKKEVIPLLPEHSLIRNSQIYFKTYNRMKTRLTIGQEKINECQTKLAYLQNVEYFIDEINDRKSLNSMVDELRAAGIDRYKKQGSKKKRKDMSSAEEPLLLSIENYRIWIGRNNRQNESLTLHKAQKRDLWLHAQKIPGAHVVIENKDTDIPMSVIAQAAAWAAWYSKGKHSGKVLVDYTQIRYVKKIPNAPPGLVNYSHQKTLAVSPMEPNSEVWNHSSSKDLEMTELSMS